MIPLKSVLVFFLGVSIQFCEIFCAEVIGSDVNTSGCQQFRTRADRYVNFFTLNSLTNEALDDEIFRYNFLLKGDRDIYILFTETDNAPTGTKCYEFGIKTSNPPASTFRTTVDGSQRIRTEESIPLSSQTPTPITIVNKEDGDVQMYVGNQTYPILRFPDNSLRPTFVSFATRGNVVGQFYFNCGIEKTEAARSALRPYVSEENAKPVVYISFNIKSISRELETVRINLHYNMTLYTEGKLSSVKTSSGSLSGKEIGNTKFQLPKLSIYSNNIEINRAQPTYNLSLDEDKLSARANESLEMSCTDVLLGLLYCNLAFGLEDDAYHLVHSPSGKLFSSALASFADVKIYQAGNTMSSSSIPLKSDIEMLFKIDSLKF